MRNSSFILTESGQVKAGVVLPRWNVRVITLYCLLQPMVECKSYNTVRSVAAYGGM